MKRRKMEIPAWLFISFWGVISFTFLHLGFRALDETELSQSVSPIIMFLFKHSLAVSSCFSSTYALKFRAQPTSSARSNYVLLVHAFASVIFPRTIEGILIWQALRSISAFLLHLLSMAEFLLDAILKAPASLFQRWRTPPIAGVVVALPFLLRFVSSPSLQSLTRAIFSCFIGILFQKIYAYTLGWFVSATWFLWAPIFTFIFYLGCLWLFCALAYIIFLIFRNNLSELRTRSGILLALEISLFFAGGKKQRDFSFSPILVLSISHFVSVAWAALPKLGDYAIVGVKVEGLVAMLKEQKAKKFAEFAVGTVGAILFQNFFRITSVGEVAAFLYFAVTWVANLVMLGFWGDFGVFNFLLANVVVGCTVGQFGLHGATWAALGAALLLFALRLKLESLHLVYGEGQRIQLSSSAPHQPL